MFIVQATEAKPSSEILVKPEKYKHPSLFVRASSTLKKRFITLIQGSVHFYQERWRPEKAKIQQ